MVIIIIGNIASGKSTLSRAIQKLVPNFHFVCLDKTRLDLFKKGYRGMQLEHKAKSDCLDQIKRHENVILESTGSNEFYRKVKLLVHYRVKHICKIIAPIRVCINRYHERLNQGHIQITPSTAKNRSIESYIRKIHFIEQVNDMTIDSVLNNPDQMLKIWSKDVNSLIFGEK